MGAIIIRTRYDEGTESAEVAKSVWLHGVLYSGEFLTKTTAAPSQEVVEGRS